MSAHEEARHKRAEAAQWLLTLLANGPRFSTDIFAAGKLLGFSRDTLFRARATAGGSIRAEKVGNGGWYWRIRLDGETAVPPPPVTPAEPVTARSPQLTHWWHDVV